MRPVSKKRAKTMRRVSPIRKAYLAEFTRCVVCGVAAADQVHEIARGSHRAAAIEAPCTWLATCWSCNHLLLTDAAEYPLERQLAIKFRVDPGRIDLGEFNALRGRDPGAITWEDLEPWLIDLLGR